MSVSLLFTTLCTAIARIIGQGLGFASAYHSSSKRPLPKHENFLFLIDATGLLLAVLFPGSIDASRDPAPSL